MALLAHTTIQAKNHPAPQRWMLFLHGILGTRANWRSLARRLVDARPDWGALLLDLREHGDSRGLPGPHTIAACVDDIVATVQALQLPVKAALGHSFGGKVAAAWTQVVADAEQLWVIDSNLGTTHDAQQEREVHGVLTALESLSPTFADRNAFIEELQAAGQSEAIANWLAMNLLRDSDGARRFGPNLDVIRALLEDYQARDLWSAVEAAHPSLQIHLVVAGPGSALSAEAKERAAVAAVRNSHVNLHRFPEAGHWIHVDAPTPLLELLVARISSDT